MTRACSFILLLVTTTLLPGAPVASSVDECPLAHQQYSSRTILLDLLIDPAARAVMERVAPSILKPPVGGREWPTEPPTFAAILTPEVLLRRQPDGPTATAALNAALARVALTPEAIRARCARYDTVPPSLPAEIRRPAILVFDKIIGFRDGPSVEAAAAALRLMASRRGWTLVFTDIGAAFNAANLARFDAVVWNNVSGDALTVPQRDAFRQWLQDGGGFAGIMGQVATLCMCGTGTRTR